MPPHDVTAAVITDDPQIHENKHVHVVYDQIASHFSSTRYKPWPIISSFLSTLPTGWVGLDSGAGNGKYLPLPLDRPGSLWTIGLDRSRNLLEIARTAGEAGVVREVVRGDVLEDGWRRGAFDYAISIATIHHLATYDRRKQAIQRLIQCVSPTHGRILIYVWAVEQDDLSKRSIPFDEEETSSQAAASKAGKDVFIPWVLNPGKSNRSASIDQLGTMQVFNRYYHMFAEGELVEVASTAVQELGLELGPPSDRADDQRVQDRGVDIVQVGWEKSNHYIELRCWGRE